MSDGCEVDMSLQSSFLGLPGAFSEARRALRAADHFRANQKKLRPTRS